MTFFASVPPAARPQLYSDALHLCGAILVTIAVSVLALFNKVPADVTGAVYTGVIGYVAGRAGNVARYEPTRTSDHGSRTIDRQ